MKLNLYYNPDVLALYLQCTETRAVERMARYYSIEPGGWVWTVYEHALEGHRVLDVFKWGFSPRKKTLQFTRLESAHTTKRWSQPFADCRVIVPITSFIHSNSVYESVDNLSFVGGIAKDGKVSILTRPKIVEGNTLRVPAVVPEKLVSDWLNPDFKHPELFVDALMFHDPGWKPQAVEQKRGAEARHLRRRLA